MASPPLGGVRRKNRQLSRWRFFYVRFSPAPGPPPRPPAGTLDEIDKNLLISWTSARSSDRPYNSG
jgi:hypothetical protein